MRTLEQSKSFDFRSCFINSGAIFKKLFLKALSRGINMQEFKDNQPRISKKSLEEGNLTQEFKGNAMLQQQMYLLCKEIFADLEPGSEFLLTDECSLLKNKDYAFLRKFLSTPVKPAFKLVKGGGRDSSNLFNADEMLDIFDAEE